MLLHWIHTSDVHGHLDALHGIETYVNNLRHEVGSANVILTDGGDVLQGHPCVYYHNFIDAESPHVVAETMNRMKYDCMAVGNHDIEAGHPVYDRVLSQFSFPALCANIVRTTDNGQRTTDGEHLSAGECYFKPYHIIEKGGLRIVVLSLITPDTVHWLSPSQYEGMTFCSPKDTVQYWISKIKQTEHYDLLVGLFHIGWDELSSLFETDDSFVLLQSFDFILYGHDHHQGIHHIGHTLYAAPSSQATSFVSLTVDTDTKQITAELKDNTSYTIASSDSSPWKIWEGITIGSIDTDLNEFDSYFGPSSFLAFTHELQLMATRAQVSLCAPISYNAFIPRGSLSNRDIFTIYNRDSQLYTICFTLTELRGILEYSYSLWTNVMTSPDDHALLMDYLLDGGTRLCLKNFTINFLTAYGISYTVDLTKPYGQKVTVLSSPEPFEGFSGWTPPWGDGGLLVAINSFHANGGGDVLTRGTGLTYSQLRERIVKVESHELRQSLAEQIKKVGDVHLQPYNNWRFIPDDWAKPALTRDRTILSD